MTRPSGYLATEEDATFHDRVGYWLRKPATGLILPVAIPRDQVATAAGHAAADAASPVLTAKRGDTGYGICSAAFPGQAFRTESCRIEVTFNPDGGWS